MALQNYEPQGGHYAWDNQTTSTTLTTAELDKERAVAAQNRRNGIQMTNRLCEFGEGRCAAAKAARSYSSYAAVPTGCSDWFLPAIGQWYDVVVNLGGASTNTSSWTTVSSFAQSPAKTTVDNVNAYLVQARDAGATVKLWVLDPQKPSENLWFWASSEFPSYSWSPGLAHMLTCSTNGKMYLDNFTKTQTYPNVRPAIAF